MPDYTTITTNMNSDVFHTVNEGVAVGAQIVGSATTTILAGTILQSSGTAGQLKLWDNTDELGVYNNEAVAVLLEDLAVTTSATEGVVAYSGVCINSRYANIAEGTTRDTLIQAEADYVTSATKITFHGGFNG
ncbi:MAG: hypothetical protein PF495_18110 [Spirochaetales bacterium]|jgi:hypothetical protein|nr:hypothetical protein [Spirochaetales bacterium]